MFCYYYQYYTYLGEILEKMLVSTVVLNLMNIEFNVQSNTVLVQPLKDSGTEISETLIGNVCSVAVSVDFTLVC